MGAGIEAEPPDTRYVRLPNIEFAPDPRALFDDGYMMACMGETERARHPAHARPDYDDAARLAGFA